MPPKKGPTVKELQVQLKAAEEKAAKEKAAKEKAEAGLAAKDLAEKAAKEKGRQVWQLRKAEAEAAKEKAEAAKEKAEAGLAAKETAAKEKAEAGLAAKDLAEKEAAKAAKGKQKDGNAGGGVSDSSESDTEDEAADRKARTQEADLQDVLHQLAEEKAARKAAEDRADAAENELAEERAEAVRAGCGPDTVAGRLTALERQVATLKEEQGDTKKQVTVVKTTLEKVAGAFGVNKVVGESAVGKDRKKRDLPTEDLSDPDMVCEICGIGEDCKTNAILVCDSCDKGYHAKCAGYAKTPINHAQKPSWTCFSCDPHQVKKGRRSKVAKEGK